MPPEPDLRGSPLRLHLVGIAGAGMAGLARILRTLGHRVTGTDARGGPFVSTPLPPDAELLIRSAAVPDADPEVSEARRRGLAVWKYAEAAGRLMRGTRGVAVAGTHGKTTTAAITAFVLREAGLDPGWLIGGEVPQFGGSSAAGAGGFFIVEACEYDRSFLNYRAEAAVITNIDADHLDCYKDLDDIEHAFRAFAKGCLWVAACGDDPRAAGLAGEGATYGFSEACAWRLEGLRAEPSGCRYRLRHLEISTPLAGAMNALNTAGAAVACLHLGVPEEAVVRALAAFRGAARRLERVGEARGIEVWDDYGHHPREIACALEGLRQRLPGRPVRVIFEPHQFHRTRVFLADFAAVLARGAGETIVPGIYGARDKEAGVSAGDLVEAIRKAGGSAREAAGLEDAARAAAEACRPGDVVLTLGAGDVGAAAPRLLALLAS